MESLRDRPVWTRVLESSEDLEIEKNSVFLFGQSQEDRIKHVSEISQRMPRDRCVFIEEKSLFEFTYSVGGDSRTISLRSDRLVKGFAESLTDDCVYLDITGLAHHIWAPLLRAFLAVRSRLCIIYAEPFDYRYNVLPTEGDIFDLSERITGIAPIPGFSTLREAAEEKVCFVPILGFEGRRFAYMVEQVQPPGDKIVPIVGVPGFRPEFPFHAFFCNQAVLRESRSWRQVRYATANDPFSLYYLLEDVNREYPNHLMKVAPIGTKPHALGAVLFAIAAVDRVELVYDHPLRKAKRTLGRARLLAYDVSSFLGLS